MRSLFKTSCIVKYIIIFCLAFILLGCKSTDALKMDGTMPIPSYVTPLSSVGDASWKIDEEIVSCSSGEGYFQTTQKFQYFNLSVDFKPEGGVNSGIFIGCEGRELSATNCYEVNIWDDHPNQRFRTGAIVTRMSPMNKVNSNGKWNTYEISVVPGKISVILNGIKTAELDIEGEIPNSQIAFQKFGKGKIAFKNIKIDRLK